MLTAGISIMLIGHGGLLWRVHQRTLRDGGLSWLIALTIIGAALTAATTL